jgi:hypothetical protein
MTRQRSVFGVVLLALGAGGFVACAAGVVGCWAVKAAVDERSAGAIDKVEHALDLTADAARLLTETMDRAGENLAAFQSDSSDLARRPIKDRIATQLLAVKVQRELGPRVDDVRATVAGVAESAVVADTVLGVIAELHLGENPRLDSARLRDVQDQVGAAARQLRDLEAALPEAGEGGAEAAGNTSTVVARTLEQSRALVLQFRSELADVRGRVSAIRARLPGEVERWAWILTGVLAWAAASQLCLLARGWTMLRRPAGNPLPAELP